jgi:hypothetical protein
VVSGTVPEAIKPTLFITSELFDISEAELFEGGNLAQCHHLSQPVMPLLHSNSVAGNRR